MLDKILGMTALTEALSNVGSTRRLISEIATIMGLTVFGAIIAGALAVFGLYECHLVLIRYGLTPDAAALVSAAIGILVLGILAAVITAKVRKLHIFSTSFSFAGIAGSTVVALANAFYRGYKDKH